MIPKIRTYFTFSDIKGASEPEGVKRPWLSIIRQITKNQYKMVSSDHPFKIDGKTFRTKRYFFHKKLHLTSKKKVRATQPNFTRYEKTKPCLSLKWKGKN